MLSDEQLLEIWHSNQCTSDDLPLLRAVAEAAVKDAGGGEVVAEVDHGKTQEIDWLVDPESLPVGTKLYTRPQNIISMPTSDEIKSSVDVLERNRNSDWGKAASEWANRPQASAAVPDEDRKYAAAVVAAFGPAEGIHFEGQSWAKLHKAITALLAASQPEVKL